MSDFAAGNGAGGVLGAIRALETALKAKATAHVDADAELEAARAAAERILASARERTDTHASERRHLLLATASADEQRIRREGEKAATELQARLGVVEDEAIERALAVLLPTPGEESTTCSRQ